MALLSLTNITTGFGGPLLLDHVNLQIHTGERVCLIGRNGTGKTTLMKIISGDLEPDQGDVSRRQSLTTAMLHQEVPTGIFGSVYDVVLDGLGEKGELHVQYHRLLAQLEKEPGDALLLEIDRIQKDLDGTGGWEVQREVETVLTRMRLEPDDEFSDLSAGMKRRVLLARALVSHPDILLLDEPTNHLDIDAIAWLEEFLLRVKSTLIFVTHDRMLVRKLATRIVELDRGHLHNWECNYDTFLERKDALLEAEQQRWTVFDKKLAQEEIWIRQGIKARRTRNEGRVAALLRMREARHSRQEQLGKVKMQAEEGILSGKLVFEAEGISFEYPPDHLLHCRQIVNDLSTLVMRGDRIGIIGPNGCGKTTMLKLLLGKLQPQKGNLKLGTNLQIAYFDQLRNQLDDDKSVHDNVADGNDRLVLDGKTRHIIGYLKDFLFTPDRSRTPVKVLSGGERNRLLLAKLFAKPSNLLVLDEPTNDLDIETLELLEDLLINYKGTILLVSHDRMFLNNVVTGSLVFEGDGRFTEYIGGYDDWLMQRPQPEESTETINKKNSVKDQRKKIPVNATDCRARKLTNKEKDELEKLPSRIEDMEEEQEQLYNRLADPIFYQQDQEGNNVTKINQRLEYLKRELTAAYLRWEELEELKSRKVK